MRFQLLILLFVPPDSALRHHNVRRFQIAMHNAFAVGCIQRAQGSVRRTATREPKAGARAASRPRRTPSPDNPDRRRTKSRCADGSERRWRGLRAWEIFGATIRSSRVSRALKTWPIPPSPTGAITWYGPNLRAGSSDIQAIVQGRPGAISTPSGATLTPHSRMCRAQFPSRLSATRTKLRSIPPPR